MFPEEFSASLQEADEDGSGELDIDEFVEKIGPHLGKDLTKTQLTQLFMKIDADAGGTVDWDEFTNYMFLQRAEPDEDDGENWRFFPQDFRAKNDLGCHHRAEIAHVLHFEHGEKYLTSGRDGTFRIWNATDLKHVKTVLRPEQLLTVAKSHRVDDAQHFGVDNWKCLSATVAPNCSRVVRWRYLVLWNCARDV